MTKRNVSSKRHRSSRVRRALRWVWNGFAVFGLLVGVYHVGFDLSQMISPSMAPTLRGRGGPGSDWVLFEKVSYWFRGPRRWEVVQFRTSDHFLVAKRVVGLPGESVSLRDQRVAINGTVVASPPSLASMRYYAYGDFHAGRDAPCGKGYFVLGDARDSLDSRFEGPISPAKIRGRAWLIVWPRARFGFVNP